MCEHEINLPWSTLSVLKDGVLWLYLVTRHYIYFMIYVK